MTKKVRDDKNRWRSKTIAFRISPEENKLLETKVRLSGLTKQDYIIRRCLEKDIIVYGNSRVHKALSDQMKEVLTELERVSDTDTLHPDLHEVLEAIVITLYGFGKDGVSKVEGIHQITEQTNIAAQKSEERGEDHA